MRPGISALCLTLFPFLVTTGGAVAADLQMGPTDTMPVATGSWTGGYIGIHADKALSDGKVSLGDFSGVLIPLDVSNGLFITEETELRGTISGGMTAGYNIQSGNFVYGVEGDVTAVSLDIDHHRFRVDPNPLIPFFGQDVLSQYETKFGAVGTLRLRAGWTLNDTMLYVTGGLAGGEVTNRFQIAIPGLGYTSPDWSESGIAWGYAVGGGIEHRITQNVSIKAEALFIDLKDRRVNGVDPVNFPGEQISYRFNNKLGIARVGINYAF